MPAAGNVAGDDGSRGGPEPSRPRAGSSPCRSPRSSPRPERQGQATVEVVVGSVHQPLAEEGRNRHRGGAGERDAGFEVAHGELARVAVGPGGEAAAFARRAGGDDGDFRRHRGQQLGRRAVVGAVVADPVEVDVEEVGAGVPFEQALDAGAMAGLRGLLEVAGAEERGGAAGAANRAPTSAADVNLRRVPGTTPLSQRSFDVRDERVARSVQPPLRATRRRPRAPPSPHARPGVRGGRETPSPDPIAG